MIHPLEWMNVHSVALSSAGPVEIHAESDADNDVDSDCESNVGIDATVTTESEPIPDCDTLPGL